MKARVVKTYEVQCEVCDYFVRENTYNDALDLLKYHTRSMEHQAARKEDDNPELISSIAKSQERTEL